MSGRNCSISPLTATVIAAWNINLLSPAHANTHLVGKLLADTQPASAPKGHVGVLAAGLQRRPLLQQAVDNEQILQLTFLHSAIVQI
jgi:hypothetical protein